MSLRVETIKNIFEIKASYSCYAVQEYILAVLYKGSYKVGWWEQISNRDMQYCKVEVPTVYGSTSEKNHWVNRCKTSPLYETSGNDKSQSILTSETMRQINALVPHTYIQKRCELKLTRYVIVDEVCFRDVEGKGFVELLHELQPRFRIPDRKKVASMVLWYILSLES